MNSLIDETQFHIFDIMGPTFLHYAIGITAMAKSRCGLASISCAAFVVRITVPSHFVSH